MNESEYSNCNTQLDHNTHIIIISCLPVDPFIMFGILSHREGMHRLKPVQACCFLWSSFYWSFSFHTLCWAMCTLSPRWSCKIKKTFTLFWLTQGKLSESADPLNWSRKLSKQKLFICVEMSSLRCNSCGHSLHSSLSFMSPSLAFWALFHCRVGPSLPSIWSQRAHQRLSAIAPQTAADKHLKTAELV